MADYSLKDLFDEYVYQREQRVSTDRALQLLGELVPVLNDKDRRQLAQWIREWELGRTNLAQPEPSQPVFESSPATVPVRPDDMPAAIYCTRCGKANPDGSKYCYACGHLLGISPALGNTSQLTSDVEDGAIFGKLSTLTLTVRGHEHQPLRVRIDDKPLLVGRSDPTSPTIPDIDFAQFNGKEMGVSRQHAVLQRENQTLTLVDKGSTNFTYINGEKVHPHEKRVVRDGDEIRFGKLPVRISFQRELRRLGG